LLLFKIFYQAPVFGTQDIIGVLGAMHIILSRFSYSSDRIKVLTCAPTSVSRSHPWAHSRIKTSLPLIKNQLTEDWQKGEKVAPQRIPIWYPVWKYGAQVVTLRTGFTDRKLYLKNQRN
jgi:hypothetical protein